MFVPPGNIPTHRASPAASAAPEPRTLGRWRPSFVIPTGSYNRIKATRVSTRIVTVVGQGRCATRVLHTVSAGSLHRTPGRPIGLYPIVRVRNCRRRIRTEQE